MRRRNIKHSYINLLPAWGIAKLEAVRRCKCMGLELEEVDGYGNDELLPDKPRGSSHQKNV